MVQGQVSLDPNHQRLHQTIQTVSSIIWNEHHTDNKLGMNSKYESWMKKVVIVHNGYTPTMMADKTKKYHTELDMKSTIRTVLNNVIHHSDGEYSYNQKLVWSKWIPDTNSQPSPFMHIVQPHLGDNFNSRDGTSQHEISSDKPRDKESI